jgi:D-beta-D-heptose 7-phosphate kinase/D-beta-D-heptose 1-phosphate adenosyltransferase
VLYDRTFHALDGGWKVKKVLVVGDSMLDVTHFGTVERICPEGPVPILKVAETKHYAGGAANVALNLRSLGVDVCLLTPNGDDDYGAILFSILRREQLRSHIVGSEKSTVKTRLFSGNQLLYRFDQDFHCYVEPIQLVLQLENFSPEIVVFSDYGKGALEACEKMIAECRQRGIFTVVDPKGSKWRKYFGAHIVKCNTPEAKAVKSGIATTKSWCNIDNVVVTESRSIEVYGRDSSSVPIFPTQYETPVDVTGAGDSFLAGMVWSLARGKELNEAIWAGAAAGRAAVLHQGTHIVTLEEVQNGINVT